MMELAEKDVARAKGANESLNSKSIQNLTVGSATDFPSAS